MGVKQFLVGDEDIGAEFPETSREKKDFGVTNQFGADALSAEFLVDPYPLEEGYGPGQTSTRKGTNFYFAKTCRLA